MTIIIRQYLLIFLTVSAFAGIAPGPALGLVMTIDAIEDAGQLPGEEAYLRFRFNDPPRYHSIYTSDVPNRWGSKQEVVDYADSKGITGWELQSAGNIWSTDLIVGDTLTGLTAGIYRISVLEGAFQYDSFGWSDDYKYKWWWQLHVQSSMLSRSWMLGDKQGFNSEAEALANSLYKSPYLDIPVNEGGTLTFWIWDTNSIDNSGSLTFNIVQIPEPSTLLLVGTGLLFLPRRFRRSLNKTC